MTIKSCFSAAAFCALGALLCGAASAQSSEEVRREIVTVPDRPQSVDVTIDGDRQVVTGQSERNTFRPFTSVDIPGYALNQAYRNLSWSFSTGMARKTREIAMLRQIVALKFSARDIERALPLLRDLKDVNKVAPVKPEQAMDEEYNALLRARPGDPMPPSSAAVLRDAVGGSKSRKQAIWDKLAQQIGREKADGLRAMLRTEGFGTAHAATLLNNFFTSPRAATPGTRIIVPDAREELRILQQPPDGVAPPRIALPAVPDGEPRSSGKVTAPRIESETEVTDEGRPGQQDTAAPAPQTDVETRRATRRPRSVPPVASVAPVAPGNRYLRVDGDGVTLLGGFGQGSLDELIDLLEKKLAAMR